MSLYKKKMQKKKDRNWVRLDPVFFSIEEIQQSNTAYSKTCVKRQLSERPQIGFQDQLLLNAGQKYCRMLQGAVYFCVAVLHRFYCMLRELIFLSVNCNNHSSFLPNC